MTDFAFEKRSSTLPMKNGAAADSLLTRQRRAAPSILDPLGGRAGPCPAPGVLNVCDAKQALDIAADTLSSCAAGLD